MFSVNQTLKDVLESAAPFDFWFIAPNITIALCISGKK